MEGKNLKEQFIGVFDKNFGIVLKIARAYTKTIHDREDLINDIAIELWKSYHKFNGTSKISTWIYRVALNTSLNFNRKQNKNKLLFLGEIIQPLTVNNILNTEENENIEILYQCIEELDELNKAIVLLYLDGKSHEEISEITGMSKTNIGTKIGRIKEQIKKLSINKF